MRYRYNIRRDFQGIGRWLAEVEECTVYGSRTWEYALTRAGAERKALRWIDDRERERAVSIHRDLRDWVEVSR